MLKKILYTLGLITILIPTFALALPTQWDRFIIGGIRPLVTTDHVLVGASATTTNATFEVVGSLAIASSTTGCAQAGTGGVVFFTGTNCGSGSGNSFGFPFTVNAGYNSTTTVIGFLNGIFSTASSTFSGPFRLPTLSQGVLYNGSSAVNSIATTSVTCAGTVSCTSFTVIGPSPITLTGSGSGSSGLNWNTATNFGQLVYATSTPTLWFQSGLFASSTSQFNNSTTSIATIGSLYLPNIATTRIPYTTTGGLLKSGSNLTFLEGTDGGKIVVPTIQVDRIRSTLGSEIQLTTDLYNFVNGGSFQIQNTTGDVASLVTTGLTALRAFTFPDEAGTFTLGTGSAGNCAQWSTTNTLTDSGSPCGSGSGSGGLYNEAGGSVTTVANSTTNATTTIITIPAGTLTASSTIQFFGYIGCNNSDSTSHTCTFNIRDSSGADYFTSTISNAGSGAGSKQGQIQGLIAMNNSVSSQSNSLVGFIASSPLTIDNISSNSSTAFNFATSKTLVIQVRTSASTGMTASISNFSVVVNTGSGSGGSGTPGGSDTQVQFNDSGSFGGVSSFTFDKTNKILTVGLGGATGTIKGGDALTTTSNGGGLLITGTDGGGTSGNGGGVSISGGNALGGGNDDGGSVDIIGGQESGGGNPGNVSLSTFSGNNSITISDLGGVSLVSQFGNSVTFDTGGLSSAGSVQFPDIGGTTDTFCFQTLANCASGGGGASAYEIATTSTIAIGEFAYFTKTGGRTTLGSVSTSTIANFILPFTSYGASTSTILGFTGGFFSTASSTISGPFRLPSLSAGTLNVAATGLTYSTGTSSLAVSSPLTVTGTLGALIGGTNSTINCQTANASQAGCLSAADFSKFNSATTTFGSGYATTTLGFLTFSTTTSTTNGLVSALTIVPSAGALTFTPSTSGTLTTAGGGTGLSNPGALGTGAVLNFNGSGGATAVSAGTAGVALVSNGSNWAVGNVSLTAGVTGILPLANGGTNSASFSGNSIITSNAAGTALIATGTQLTVGNLLATTTATSTFIGGIKTNLLNVVSTIASSTFASGINLTGGCFAINNTCISGSGGSGTVTSVGLSLPAAFTVTNSPVTTSGTLTATVAFASGAILTADSAGTNIIATTSQVTVGSLLSTTTVFSKFTGGIAIGTTTPHTLGSFQIASNTPYSFLTENDGPVDAKHWYTSVLNGTFSIGTTSDTSFVSTSTAFSISAPNVASPGTTVGIATTSPWRTLSVKGTVGFDGLTGSAGLQVGILCLSAVNEVINESVACVASAERFKQNIKPLTVGLDELLKLKPVSFNWKPEYNGALQTNPNFSGTQYSLIADDVMKIDKNLVSVEIASTTFDGVSYPAGTVHGLADGNHWYALIVQSIKDFYGQFQKLVARVSGLEKKVADQQKQIDALTERLTALEQK